MRIGILGGAFNPPHIGHLICAQQGLVELGLENVILIPVGEAPHRELEDDAGAELRLEMCERAVACDERLLVSRIEVDRPGPSYSVETLRQLRERAPDDELVLIVGGDQAATLPSWREPDELLRLATVAAVERDGSRRKGIRRELAGLAGADRVTFFEMPRIDVSSTLIRRRIRAGQPIRYLVPESVADLIATRHLYEPSARRASEVGGGGSRQ